MCNEERNQIRNTIKEFLAERGFNFESDVLGITVDCGGQGLDFARLIDAISKNVEEWTYDSLLDLKIEIDLPYEQVKFRF